MKLKNINLGLGLMALLALSSCADDKFSEYRTDMTKNLKDYQYLNNYEPLKKYVEDMKAAGKCNPDFKLGIALGAADFNKQELVYCLAGSNFNEMTAGNAMKMASCVKDDGSMDFSTVKEFVKNAQDADMTIYGHTLAWHSQAANKYLNGIIAAKEIEVDPDAKIDKIDYEKDWSTAPGYSFWAPDDVKANIKVNTVEGALQIDNAKATDNWMIQYHVADGLPTKTGKTYKLKMTIKATGEGSMSWGVGGWGGRAEGSFGFDTEWKEVEKEFVATADGGFVLCQTGQFVGSIYIKNVQITHTETPAKEVFKDYITNGAMESGKSMENFVVTEAGKPLFTPVPVAGGPDGKNCIVIHGNANAATEWDTQFFINTPKINWKAGDQYKISFYYKASDNIGSATQCHGAPGGYIHWACLPTNPSFTTKWQKYEMTGTIPSEVKDKTMHSIAFNLNVGKVDHAVDYYFADVHWGVMEKTNKIELTDEQKKDVLTTAMGTWIDGMMEATNGYVTSWDVVNEALSGEDKDGDGKFDLQSAKRGNVSAADAQNNFYWQDYLGDIDYVRTAVAAARKSFAAHNGDPEKLKLFINDYNLESDWDDNGKLKSLIQWIHDWEADGVTKIDGIASQMHISCYADPNTQKSKKDHIVKMLELMAKSGKLCKISELDMGYVDAAGKEVKTVDMTEEQHKEMRDLYTFVLQKYFEIIPIDKQYGITQWCATDSPKDSGWRPGLPVGLWDLNYLRKHTYAGFAVGLGAPEYWKEAK